jgi:hypothetical protein
MRYRKRFLGTFLLLVMAITGWSQSEPSGYNPFVSANLDDATKLTVTTVVEGSYHHYWIKGDSSYVTGSEFVWYVKNGTFGTYYESTGVWVENTGAVQQSDGTYLLTLAGKELNSQSNSSEIWVKWDENTGGSFGYIAVYERSSNGCIDEDMIKGFKHSILSPPQVWFAESTMQVCSEQGYTVELHFNNIDALSYPYTVYYERPSVDGNNVSDKLIIAKGSIDDQLLKTYYLDLNLVNDRDVTKDETYTIKLDSLIDGYGARGKIAPLGSSFSQYGSITLTILHLPQTGKMLTDDQ